MSEPETSVAPEPYRIGALGRHSLIYGIGLFLSKAVAVVMLPVYTRWLTPADYGALQLISLTFEFIAIVAGSRIALGIFHFYNKAGDDSGRREVASTAWLLFGVMYGVAAIGTILAAPWIARFVFEDVPSATTLIRLAAASMAFEGLLIMPLALIQLQDRSSVFVMIGLARLLLQVVCNLIFLIPLNLGVIGVLWGSVTTHVVMGVSMSVWLLSSVGARFATRTAIPFLRFGLPLVVMNLAAYFATFGDRYFLNRAGSVEDVGLYGLAYQFGFLVATVGYVPFAQVWDPQRFAVAKRPDRNAIFARVFIYLNVPLVAATLGIVLFAGDALRIMATPEFQPAAQFVPVIALAYFIQSWSYFFNLGIFVTERTEYFTIANWVAAFVALGGFLWLIPPLLVWGATLTTLARMCVLAWLCYVFSQRLWPVEYRWGPVVRLSLLGLAVGTASELLPALPLVLSIVAHTALFGVFVALLWMLPILLPEERATIRQWVERRVGIVRTAT